MFIGWMTAMMLGCGGDPGLSVDDLTKISAEVHGFQPLADANTKLESLGAPHSDADGTRVWYAHDGDSCQKFTVTAMGDAVGTATLEPADCPE